MFAEDWTNPLIGGGPLKDHPMRAETFNYPKNNQITDMQRLVTQGRINLDTKKFGSKFWGSYEQGLKKTMSEKTQSCTERFAYFFVMVQNTDEVIGEIILEFESSTLKYAS